MAIEETYQQSEAPLDESSGHLGERSSLFNNVSDSADATNAADVASTANTEGPATQNDTSLSSEIVFEGISDKTAAEETLGWTRGLMMASVMGVLMGRKLI